MKKMGKLLHRDRYPKVFVEEIIGRPSPEKRPLCSAETFTGFRDPEHRMHLARLALEAQALAPALWYIHVDDVEEQEIHTIGWWDPQDFSCAASEGGAIDIELFLESHYEAAKRFCREALEGECQ